MIHMRCVEETNYKHITSTWTFLSTDAHKTIAVPCSCTGRNNKKFIKNQILAHKLVLDARLGGVRKISALPSVVYGICMPSSFLWLLTLWNWRELMIIDHQHLWLLVRFECSPTRCTPPTQLARNIAIERSSSSMDRRRTDRQRRPSRDANHATDREAASEVRTDAAPDRVSYWPRQWSELNEAKPGKPPKAAPARMLMLPCGTVLIGGGPARDMSSVSS